MQEFDEIWNLVLEDLEKNLSSTVFSLWIKDLRLISLTDTDAVLYTESALKKDVLEKNGINDRVLRLSVGIEGIADLICEFNRVFAIAEEEAN